MEEYQASPEMKLFFEGLLDLKKFVKEHVEQTKDPVLKKIYDKLDSLIKEGE